MFAIILRVHVTVGNPVSVFAFKVTPNFWRVPSEKQVTRDFHMKPK